MNSRRKKVLLYRSVKEIEMLKEHLNKMSHDVETLSDPGIVAFSQRIDKILNFYYRLTGGSKTWH